MKVFILLFATLASTAYCGIISHDDGHGGHGKATSYQNVHIESYHPVPVYIKKEDYKYLEHPVKIGSHKSSVEIHHGEGKHDHGYAIVNTDHHGHGGHEELAAYGGHEEYQGEGLGSFGGHEEYSAGGEGYGQEEYHHHGGEY